MTISNPDLIYLMVIYALTQILLVYIFTEIKYAWLLLLPYFALIFMSDFFSLGESFPGFLSMFLIFPTLAVFTLQIIENKKVLASYAGIGVIIQIIYIVADTHANIVSRLFTGNLKTFTYSVCSLLLSCFYALILKKIIKSPKTKIHLFFSRNNLNNTNQKPEKDKVLFFLCLTGILTGILICVIYFMYLIYNKITNKFTLIIGIFAFLVIIFSSNLAMFLFWRYLLEKHQNKIRQNEISSLLTYVSAIEETYKKIREFKHDYKNILLGISVKDDKLIREELEKAINSTLFNINSNDIISDLSVIENVPVKAILSAKIIHFLNNDMDVHFGIIGKVRDIDMDEYDIVRVLGILLDNAYEEAINTKERYIKIVILKKAESLIFIIENSCGDTTVQIETIMESGYSTKGKGRGLGLANLRDITSTYDNCSFQIGKTDDGNFCAKLIIDTL